MNEITTSEEFTRDWDWYAHDLEGNIGHFTTAGLRCLPKALKEDRAAAERVVNFFLHDASETGSYNVRPGVETEAGGWDKPGARDRFLKSFAEMARKGTFSYNTEMIHGSRGRYYLVAIPEYPIHIADLPPEIARLVCRVRAPLLFATTDHIAEGDTLLWEQPE
jgi:hypothetical protein